MRSLISTLGVLTACATAGVPTALDPALNRSIATSAPSCKASYLRNRPVLPEARSMQRVTRVNRLTPFNDTALERAAWLPTPGLDARHYAVKLDVPKIDSPVILARATIKIGVAKSTKVLRLHAEVARIAITSVKVDGREAPYSSAEGKGNRHGLKGDALLIELPHARGGEFKVELAYEITVGDAKRQEGLFFDPSYEKTAVLSTRSWPYFGRMWLPSHDHPSDQASFDFEIEAPKGLDALASGRLVSRTPLAGGRERWRWSLDAAIPTYAANIIIAKMNAREIPVCFEAGKPTLKALPCRPGLKKIGFNYYWPSGMTFQKSWEAEILKSADSLAWLASAIGNYEFGNTLGVAVAPHPFSMEHVGLITLVEPGAAVHEIVHQWFGNSVAIPHWGELWISEGFTTYVTGFYDELINGTNSSCLQKAGRLDNPDATDVLDIFDDVAYCKGAAALDDLRVKLATAAGDTKGSDTERMAFVALLRQQYADFRLRPMSTADYRDWLKQNAKSAYDEAGLKLTVAAARGAVAAWYGEWFGASR